MKICISMFLCQLCIMIPQCCIFVLLCKINIIQQCLDIKTGSAGNDRDLFFFINLLQGFFCHFLKPYHMELILRSQHINQIMRYPLHFLRCYFGRTNIHASVHLHGICRNYCPVDFFCQRNRQLRLSYRRRTGQN